MLGGMEGRRRRRRRRAAAGVCFGRVVARGGRGEGVAGLGEKEGKRRAILARWAGPGGLDGWIGGCVRDTNIHWFRFDGVCGLVLLLVDPLSLSSKNPTYSLHSIKK